MRLRTLPVSVAGVIAGVAMAVMHDSFQWLPTLICLSFAVLAQIASNFANEYFDYRDGLDKKGRVGPRRGVTEGDITPRAMLTATLATLGVAALLGLSLIWWGGWWLLLAGILIVLGALAYSAGPYPLSRHGWGEVAVVVFFGIAPVTLTYYILTGTCTTLVWMLSVAMGLLGANVLIVNNYRDIDDDRAVGKMTLAVRFGPRFTTTLYLVNGVVAFLLMLPVWCALYAGVFIIFAQLLAAVGLWRQLCRLKGVQLNPMLGRTAKVMFLFALLLLIESLFPLPAHMPVSDLLPFLNF